MRSIVETINESKTNPRDIEKYVKSWVTNCLEFDDYLVVLKALCKGWNAGISENQKYYKPDYKGGIPKEAVDRIDDDLFNKWLDLENYTEYNKILK